MRKKASSLGVPVESKKAENTPCEVADRKQLIHQPSPLVHRDLLPPGAWHCPLLDERDSCLSWLLSAVSASEPFTQQPPCAISFQTQDLLLPALLLCPLSEGTDPPPRASLSFPPWFPSLALLFSVALTNMRQVVYLLLCVSLSPCVRTEAPWGQKRGCVCCCFPRAWRVNRC